MSEVITKLLALFLGVLASSFVSIFYLIRFFNVKHYQSFLRSFAFFLFFIASLLALLLGSPNDFSLPIAALGMVILYISLVLDYHSHLRYTVPLPFLALFFFRDHQLLLVLSLLDGVSLLELAYSNEHKRLIPFVAALTIVVIAEYFNAYGPVLKVSSEGVNILYIIASLIFLLWILFYMAREAIKLLKGEG